MFNKVCAMMEVTAALFYSCVVVIVFVQDEKIEAANLTSLLRWKPWILYTLEAMATFICICVVIVVVVNVVVVNVQDKKR